MTMPNFVRKSLQTTELLEFKSRRQEMTSLPNFALPTWPILVELRKWRRDKYCDDSYEPL